MLSRLLLTSLVLTASAAAQPQWSPRFAFTGFVGRVESITTFDPDGPGPLGDRLCAGGRFDAIEGKKSKGMALWDGQSWTPVPNAPVSVYRFFSPEPATGRLIMSSYFSEKRYLHAWDGKSFAKLGELDEYVEALGYWDSDGPGPIEPLMIAGGAFDTISDQTVNMLGAWDGAKWSEVGGGAFGDYYAAVRSIISWDIDGDGPGLPALIVAGTFTQVGDQAIAYLAQWDGSEWTEVGGGVDGGVLAAALFDEDGPGPERPALFVAGLFKNAGGQPIPRLARFDGQAWSEAGAPDDDINGLQVIDLDGEGPLLPRLAATGFFTSIGGQEVSNIATWDGASWSPLGVNLRSDYDHTSLAVFDPDGPGEALPECFTTGLPVDSPYTDNQRDSAARLEGNLWREQAGGLTNMATSPPGVFALTSFTPVPDGPPLLVIGGSIDSKVLTWDGIRLLNAGADLCCHAWNWPFYGPWVYAAGAFDEDGPGSAPARAAIGGWFESVNWIDSNGVAGWDGSAWAPMGLPYAEYVTVEALLAPDLDGDGPLPPVLLAGGFDIRAPDGKDTGGIVHWDGAHWQPFDAGINRNGVSGVYALTLVDHDGDGAQLPVLYATGEFSLEGDGSSNVALWDGARWQPVGGGFSAAGRALAPYDPDGDGPGGEVLIAGGDFHTAGGQSALRVATWDGQEWLPMGGGINDTVHALASTSGQVPRVYAGGAFTQAGGVAANRVASWNGSEWEPLGEGVDDTVAAAHVHDDDGPGPAAPAVYFGGRFQHAGGLPSAYLARWGEPETPGCPADCDQSGALDVTDWLCFVALFNTADPAADCDASGGLDLFDFLCFINAFNAGC